MEKNHLDLVDDEIENIEQISVGDILHGYINTLTNRQITLLLGSGKTLIGHIEKVINRSLNGHLREYLDVGMVLEAVVLKYTSFTKKNYSIKNLFFCILSVDTEKNKCQMKLTDQCIEQIVSKRSKRHRLSRASSLVS